MRWPGALLAALFELAAIYVSNLLFFVAGGATALPGSQRRRWQVRQRQR
jgi:hypothetical protein